MFEIQLVADRALLQAVERPLFWIVLLFLAITAVTAVLVRRQLRRERAAKVGESDADTSRDTPQ